MEQIPTVGVDLTSLLAVVVAGLSTGAEVVIGVLTTEVFIVVGAAVVWMTGVVETTPFQLL